MKIYPLVLLFALVIVLFGWSVTFGMRRRDAINRAFLLLSGAAAAWLLGDLVQYLPLARGNELALLRGMALFWLPLGHLFLHFAYRLVGRPLDLPYFASAIVAAVGAVLVATTDIAIVGFEPSAWGTADVRAPAHLVFANIPTVSVLLGIALVWRRLRLADESLARTYRLVLIGAFLALGVCWVFNVMMPSIVGTRDFPQIGSAALSLFTIFIYFAVRRYNFLVNAAQQMADDLFDDVHDGFIILDHRGTVRRANRAARQLFGWQESLVGRYRAPREIDTETDYVSREVALTVDETPRRFSVSVSRSRRGSAELGCIIVLRDVTEQRRAETILRRSRDELEAAVEQRTNELAQSQKMEALGTLAGGIAHDFNNALAVIIGYSDLAANALDADDEVQQDIKSIKLAGMRARDVVKQILAFSRRDGTALRPVKIGAVVEEALGLLEVTFPAKIAMQYEVERDCGVVLGDESAISQVVVNLGTNALHAMEADGGTLTVKLFRDTISPLAAKDLLPLEPGPHVCLLVSDTGCGMDQVTRDQVFEPFFTTKPKGQGTGLGLSTVANIMHNHHGSIGVHSAPGEGTTVTVYWPEKSGEAGHSSAVGPCVGGQERILFVDDEPEQVRIGERRLQALGYHFTGETSPRAAWRQIESGPAAFDLLITDFDMPDLTGLELAERVLGLRPELPVILLSGRYDASLQKQAEAVGLHGVLSKPIDTRHLDQAIRQAVSAVGGRGTD